MSSGREHFFCSVRGNGNGHSNNGRSNGDSNMDDKADTVMVLYNIWPKLF